MRLNFDIPTSWNELTNWQLKRIASIFFSDKDTKKVTFLLVVYLFMPRLSLWNILKLFFLFMQVPYSALKEYTKFLYEENDLTRFPKKLRSRFSYLHGPADRLSNVTIEEYAYADLFYYNWAKTKSTTDLDRLVSVLYRPKANETEELTDLRQAFDKDKLRFHAKSVERLSTLTKITIMMAFQGCRDNIIKRYTNVYKKGKSKSGYAPFTKIIASMARGESQPFGDYYKTKQANVFDFMEMLDEEIKEQRLKLKKTKKK
jgi:hypothetical protein